MDKQGYIFIYRYLSTYSFVTESLLVCFLSIPDSVTQTAKKTISRIIYRIRKPKELPFMDNMNILITQNI